MVAIHMRPLCVLTIFRISLLMMTPNCVVMSKCEKSSEAWR